MEFIKRLLGMGARKPFKIQDINGQKRIGVMAASLKEFRRKGSVKLGISNVGSIVLEEDGTRIDDEDYFNSLSDQSVLVFLQPGEVWEGYITYLKLASTKILDNVSIRKETIDEIQARLYDPDSPELLLMMEYVHVAHANIQAERRQEDPDWFEGVSTSMKTKTQVMRESAKGRVRGYLWKTKEFTEKMDIPKFSRKALKHIITCFQEELKRKEYNARYFDRTAETESEKLCSDKGWFSCQGAFDRESCDNSHTINPYASKDTRVFFSTWNLDHRIEKSREVLPQLVHAITNCPKDKEVNWRYFYQLLFTVSNLKLVDIRCHRKDKHENYKVDKRKVYVEAVSC